MRLLFVATLALSLIGCVHSSHNENIQETQKSVPKKIIEFQSKNASPAEITECQKQGGKVQKVGMLQFDKCIITYPDAGKTCTKGDDCQSGACEPKSDNAQNINTPITGVCKANNNPFGCRSFIHDGQAQTLCVD
ncbi:MULTISPECIES: hypothetical protein [Moraxella]|uniref:Lipoprotein n=1 Tax=Moraxella lacunata TaxID=477 RepID=A0A1B8Q335_MORLA|nr:MULTISPECIES: hypothetical protein [Moraxella]MBE9579586.1 hypothetical protein [Moraxella sp. K1664]MBE9588932.1 hypothetical protein [Moraxella sp. K1630]MBE9591501.1 hypothetical protein [Moraxella sp. K127]MBE9597376.1 hypothetical protein [Moraxella sp. K2450]MDI4483664.1 hypothetical protein [Moraxella lacunata]